MSTDSRNVLSSGEFSGMISRSVKQNGIIFCKTHYGEIMNPAWHSHENLHFSLVFDNAISQTKKRDNYTVKDGTLLILREDEIHRYINGTFSSFCLNLELSSDFFNEYELKHSDLEHLNLQDPSLKLKFIQLSSFFDHKNASTSDELIVEVISLLSDENCTYKTYTKWHRQLLEILHDEWSEKLNLNDLGKRLNIHPVTISKLCSNSFSCTFSQYRLKLKIERSLSLLLDLNNSILEVAMKCNFTDQSHFTREFKRFTKLTPHQFRRLNSYEAKSVINSLRDGQYFSI